MSCVFCGQPCREDVCAECSDHWVELLPEDVANFVALAAGANRRYHLALAEERRWAAWDPGHDPAYARQVVERAGAEDAKAQKILQQAMFSFSH